MSVFLYDCMYAYMYVCMYVCMYAYVLHEHAYVNVNEGLGIHGCVSKDNFTTSRCIQIAVKASTERIKLVH